MLLMPRPSLYKSMLSYPESKIQCSLPPGSPFFTGTWIHLPIIMIGSSHSGWGRDNWFAQLLGFWCQISLKIVKMNLLGSRILCSGGSSQWLKPLANRQNRWQIVFSDLLQFEPYYSSWCKLMLWSKTFRASFKKPCSVKSTIQAV